MKDTIEQSAWKIQSERPTKRAVLSSRFKLFIMKIYSLPREDIKGERGQPLRSAWKYSFDSLTDTQTMFTSVKHIVSKWQMALAVALCWLNSKILWSVSAAATSLDDFGHNKEWSEN